MQDRRRFPRFIRLFGTHTHRHAYTHIYYVSLYAPFEEKCFVGRERKAAMGQKEIDSKSRMRAADWFDRSVYEIHLNKSVVRRWYIIECIIILYYYVLEL